LREYARERLASSGTAIRTAQRHVDYFLTLAERAEPQLRRAEQVEWLERLELDHDNLRVALRWSMEHRTDQAMRLGAALWRFWYMRGHLTEGRESLDACLKVQGALASSIEERSVRAWVLNGAGNLAASQSDSAAARDFHLQALAI